VDFALDRRGSGGPERLQAKPIGSARAALGGARLVAMPHRVYLERQPELDAERDLSRASDEELAHALLASAPEAPQVTWQRFAPLVRRIIARSLGAERDVDDTVQDVFLNVFDKVPTLRNPASLRAFIVSVAIRTLRSEIRRLKVRGWSRLQGPTEAADPRSVQIDTDSREALTRFYEILDRINLRDRTAFEHHFLEGMEIAEVAQSMNTSVPTIRRCLARARGRLALLAARDPILVDYVSLQARESLTPAGASQAS
jgi:RNA polymerase sigma-70 factor (ECF subfamily)